MLLEEVTSKTLPQPLEPDSRLLAYCPTMDLVALVTAADGHVHVFRLNGQRVLGVVPPRLEGRNKEEVVRPVALAWKPNGRALAVAYTNGIILLVSTYTGKVAHEIELPVAAGNICALGWGANLLEPRSIKTRLERLNAHSKEGGGIVTLDDVIAKDGVAAAAVAVVGEGWSSGMLDRDILADAGMVDAEQALPPLAVLPAGLQQNDIFASTSSIDAVFNVTRKDSNELADVLVVGFEDGTVHLSIYDFFEIGRFDRVFADRGLRVVHHCSHPYSSTCALLLADAYRDPEKLFFMPLDLRLISESRRYLSVLASKSTQLQLLLRYLQQTKFAMYGEFATSQDLPSKFMRNIDETLREKEHQTFPIAAYHLAATGHCSPSVKEWLVDELGERGHKRWDKAVTSGYENLARFILQNLLPALDRFGLVVSRLRGLAKFYESTSRLGLEKVELDRVLDTLSCLFVLSHTILITSGEEIRLFSAFSKWLKLEIETQAIDSNSASNDDAAEKYSTIHYDKVFQYIEGAMQGSALYDYLNLRLPDDDRPLAEMPPINEPMYNEYKAKMENKDPAKKAHGLDLMLERLNRQCKIIFNRIAETQKRKVRFGRHVLIDTKNIVCFDARMVEVAENDSTERFTTYIAVAKKKAALIVKKVTITILNGISSNEDIATALVAFPTNAQIQEMKFADDETLLVVLKCGGSSRLIYLPYATQASSSDEVLQYDKDDASPVTSTTREKPCLDFSLNANALDRYTHHIFGQEAGSAPERLAVNGRKGRRVVCVTAEDRIRYRVYDLDSHADGSESGDTNTYADMDAMEVGG